MHVRELHGDGDKVYNIPTGTAGMGLQHTGVGWGVIQGMFADGDKNIVPMQLSIHRNIWELRANMQVESVHTSIDVSR